MNDLIKRIELNREEFKRLYDEGVLGYTSGVQVTRELFKKLTNESEVFVDIDTSNYYPVTIRARVGFTSIFTIMDLKEYVESDYYE